ncbi:hypothetical protein [Nocardia sp. NPDC048505]|uniref:hypothetical protein n=1 Tax=unclassified Nocardia TaxID=2637762 RepID=UPI003404C36C
MDGAEPNRPAMSGMQQLVAEILARYGSIDAFCARLHELVDDSNDNTEEIPHITADFGQPEEGGRHRLRTPLA